MDPSSIITLLTPTLHPKHWLGRSWFTASSVNTLSRLFQAQAGRGNQRAGNCFHCERTLIRQLLEEVPLRGSTAFQEMIF